MKTLVVYYTLSGRSEKVAQKIKEERGADIFQVKELKKRGMFNAFLLGAPAAFRKKKAVIEALDVRFYDYDLIVIVMPIWAGYPAPAFNNVVSVLPSGKSVELVMVSASGSSSRSKDSSNDLVKAKGCTVTGYTDIKA